MGRIRQLSDLRKWNRDISHISTGHLNILSKAGIPYPFDMAHINASVYGFRKYKKCHLKFLIKLSSIDTAAKDLYSLTSVQPSLNNITKYRRRDKIK